MAGVSELRLLLAESDQASACTPHISFNLGSRREKFTGIIGLLQVNQGSANAVGELFLQLFGVFPGYLGGLQMLCLIRFIAGTVVKSGDAVIALTSSGKERDRDEYDEAFHWLPSETVVMG